MGGDSNVADVNALLQTAEEEQIFSQMSLDAIKAGDLGAQIGAGLGATPDNLKAAEAILVASIIDNSGSIAGISDGPEAVCGGQNLYLDAFGGSKQEAGLLMGTWLVNEDTPVHPFVAVSDAVRLEEGVNYRASGPTPLYRRTCAVLATLGLKMQVEYLEAGCACRGILLIVTDGRDEDYSGRGKAITADHCRAIIEDLGEILIVQFMGIEGNDAVDFRQIAIDMGVQDQHIITPQADPHAIREAFEFASKSAVSASKSADSFSKTAMQGFTV
jgi:hypothetical protein